MSKVPSRTLTQKILAARISRTLLTKLLCASSLTFLPVIAYASSLGGQVAAGAATITQAGPSNVTINQQSQNAIINWQSFNSFNIGKGDTMNFVQPNASAIALNRVVGVNPSSILGTLNANGRVWLINPNGIAFGQSARINVAGLLATTIDISDRDFMRGNYQFATLGKPSAMVVNAGNITIRGAGLAALVAPGVENSGVIRADLGQIQLSSTAAFTVDLYGDGQFNFLLDKQAAQQLARADGTAPSANVTNTGRLIADGGQILLTADAAKSVLDNAIDMTGYAQARSVSMQDGTIVLDGGTGGRADVSGTLDASGQKASEDGGTIKVLSGMESGNVAVSGTLDASAHGGGNGGFIETSAAHVTVADKAKVTTAAPYGKTGTWLIDPHDYTIAATGGDITGAALTHQLASNNVTILSGSGASVVNGDINVNDAVNWSANTLTLTAAHSININAVMTATDNASLALNPFTANQADSVVGGGTVLMGMDASGNFIGRVDFNGTGTLFISGTPYIVINSLGVAGDTSSTTLQGMSGSLSGHYVLGSNIDATATSGWNAGLGFNPIGDGGAPFTGTFDGLGHTISNLTISRTAQYIGLFGYTSGPSVISDVGLLGANVIGNYTSLGVTAGTLVGYNQSLITRTFVGGSITGTMSTPTGPWMTVGGLIGQNRGTVSYSHANVTVSGSASDGKLALIAGGLIGEDDGSTSYSYASGTVSASGPFISGNAGALLGGLVGASFLIVPSIDHSFATGSVDAAQGIPSNSGGLVGQDYNGDILDSYATGNVSGGMVGSTGDVVGGLVGSMGGAIERSYATGGVTGGGVIGGLVGSIRGPQDPYPALILQSYATGSVNGTGDIGGLVGYGPELFSISQSYATGSVSGSGNLGGLVGHTGPYGGSGPIDQTYATGAVNGTGNLGGLIGYSDSMPAVSNSYWDATTSGQSSSVAGASLTSAQLKAGLPTGFDATVWAISPSINNGYPYLLVLAPSGGTVALIPLTWSVADASDTYGTLANFGAVTLSGVSSVDSSSVLGTLGLFSGATAVTLSPTTPAGTYSEEVTGLTGSAAEHYSLATSGNTFGSLIINPKALTWLVDNVSSTFGTISGLGATHLYGIVGSDNVIGTAGAFSGSSAVTLSASTPVGTYTERVTGLNGSAASNYTLASAGNTPGTLSVVLSTPVLPPPPPPPGTTPVTWNITNATSTYGTLGGPGIVTLSGVSSSDSGSVFGTLELLSGTTPIALSAATPAGTYSEVVTGLIGSAAGNYALAMSGNTGGSLVITPKPLNWSVGSHSVTYGTTPTHGTVNLSGIVGSDKVNGIVGAFNGNKPVTLSASTPVGTYSERITGLSGSAAGNYTLASAGNSPGTLTVSAASTTPPPPPTVNLASNSPTTRAQIVAVSQMSQISTTVVTAPTASVTSASLNREFSPSFATTVGGLAGEYINAGLQAFSSVSGVAANRILSNPSLSDSFSYFLNNPNDLIVLPDSAKLARSNTALWESVNDVAAESGVLTQRLGETLQDMSKVADAARRIAELATIGTDAASLFSSANAVFTQTRNLSPSELITVIQAINNYTKDPVGSARTISSNISTLEQYSAVLSNNSNASKTYLAILRDGATDALLATSNGRMLLIEQKVITEYVTQNVGAINDVNFLNQKIEVPVNRSIWNLFLSTQKISISQAAQLGYVSLSR